MMNSAEVLNIYEQIIDHPEPEALYPQIDYNPLIEDPSVRPHTASIADTFFGDAGKGAVATKMNRFFTEQGKKVVSVGTNGGDNAGHESLVDGRKIVGHQIPLAIAQEGATALITRGKVIHPSNLVAELMHMEQSLGNIPGQLIIDGYAPLALDTHRAFEAVLKAHTDGSKGATGSGIAPAYADRYLRIARTMNDLMADDWEEHLRSHYRLYQKLMGGFGSDWNLEDIVINVTSHEDFKRMKQTVGTEQEFIDRLADARTRLKPYVAEQTMDLLYETWNDPEHYAYTFELSQGGANDSWHGVYPDNTASRPLTRFVGDSTYGVVEPEDIALKMSLLKTVYMSSVGSRRLPTQMPQEEAAAIRHEQNEVGRTTGRSRDVLEISIPIAQYIRRVDGYQYLAATHMDAARPDRTINVITHYTDKVTGKERPYMPYQDQMDKLEAHVVTFPGWDGEAIKGIQDPSQLPPEAKRYLAYLSATIAPVAIGTYGPDVGEWISWIPNLKDSIAQM